MIGMIGGGSWATALIKILLEKSGDRVEWWVRSPEVARGIERRGRNPHHLSALKLDASRLDVSTDLAQVVGNCDLLFLSVPSAYLAPTLATLPTTAWEGKRIASAVKGFVPESNSSVSDYLIGTLHIPSQNICVVSGPSHAEEVAVGQDTFLNVASTNPSLAEEVAGRLQCSYIHTTVVDDVRSLELCGMAKNVYAVAAGMATALGGGDNLTAMLTAAATHEMISLIGCSHIAYRLLGDLMVTCFSHHSRNRALGEAVVAGISPDEHFRRTGMVAEGYFSARVLHLMQKNADTPIADSVYRVLHEGTDPDKELRNLIDNVF